MSYSTCSPTESLNVLATISICHPKITEEAHVQTYISRRCRLLHTLFTYNLSRPSSYKLAHSGNAYEVMWERVEDVG